MDKKYFLCKSQDIDDPGSKGIVFNNESVEKSVFLVKNNGQISAYLNICPHMGAELNWQDDQFLNYNKTAIQCSLHGAQFTIQEGKCTLGPCVGSSLTQLNIIVENDDVFAIEKCP